MILFDLKCDSGHVFEAWFRDNVNFDAQAKAGEIICPLCGDAEISKAPMAPRLAGTGTPAHDAVDREGSEDGLPPTESCTMDYPGSKSMASTSDEKISELIREITGKLRNLRGHIETECDYVGDRFTEEARKIHYCETEERKIYGEATDVQAEELTEEGIEFFRIPWVRHHDS